MINKLLWILYRIGLGFVVKLIDVRLKNNFIVENEKNRTVVMVGPQINWGIIHQRPQNVAKSFADLGYKVYYCIWPYSISDPDAQVDNIFEIQENIFLLVSLDAWHKHIECVDIVYSCYPWHVAQVRHLKRKFTNAMFVYDIFDDISLFAKKRKQLTDHKWLINNCDRVWHSADRLKSRVDSLYVPNGVDVSKFQEYNKYMFDDRLVIGYYGAIDTWFDFDFLKCLLEVDTYNKYLIIGKVSDKVRADLDKLLNSFDNIVYLGIVDYNKLPLISSFVDYGLIPFKINSITLATSPIKLYEYLAVGANVISVDLPEVRKLKDKVFIVRNADEAIRIIKEREVKKCLHDDLKGYSWTNRVKNGIL